MFKDKAKPVTKFNSKILRIIATDIYSILTVLLIPSAQNQNWIASLETKTELVFRFRDIIDKICIPSESQQWIANGTLKGLITLAYFNPPTIYIAEESHLNHSIPNALEK